MYDKILKIINDTESIKKGIAEIVKKEREKGHETYNVDSSGVYKTIKINNEIKKDYIKKYK